jgi:hypothetical protein
MLDSPSLLCKDTCMKIKATTTEKLNTICTDSTTCHCTIISGDKACSMVHLINEFVSETNPVTVEMSQKDYSAFVLYLAIASLREMKGGE